MNEFRDHWDQIIGLRNLSLGGTHISFFINPIGEAFFINAQAYRWTENTRCCHEQKLS